MADTILGNLVWRITGDNKDFDKKIKGSNKAAGGFGKSLLKIGKAAAVAFAVKKVVDFTKRVVTLASDLAESQNAVNVVFGNSAKQLDEFSKNSVTSVGLIRTEFNSLATTTGAVLKQTGLDMDTVAGKTIELSQRAADTASIFNVDVKDAMNAYGAALRGEAEPARRFGINLSDSAVQAEALASGLVKNKNEITDQIKVQARYNLIMKQSSGYAGDFANTQDGFANGLKIAKKRMEENATVMGQAFLPFANVGVQLFNKMAEKSAATAEGIRDFTTSAEGSAKIAAIFGGIAGAMEILGDIGKEIFDNLIVIFKDVAATIGDLTGASQDSSVAFKVIATVSETLMSVLRVLGKLLTLVIVSLVNLGKAAYESGKVVSAFIDRLKGKISKEEFKKTLDGSAQAFKEFGGAIADEYTDFFTTIKDEVSTFADRSEESAIRFEKIFTKKAKEVETSVKKALLTAGGAAKTLEQELNDLLDAANKKTEEASKKAADETKKAWGAAIGYIQSGLETLGNVFGSLNTIQENNGAKEIQRIQALVDATEEGTEERIALEEQLEAKKKQIAIEAAKREKSLGIFQATISTANAIIGFLKDPGGIAGIGLSIAAGITGAAQIAAIASAPLPYATGGIVPGTEYQGDRVPALVNSGEMILNQGQQAKLFNIANGGGGGAQTINVHIGGKLVAREVVDAINNGIATIKMNRGLVAR